MNIPSRIAFGVLLSIVWLIVAQHFVVAAGEGNREHVISPKQSNTTTDENQGCDCDCRDLNTAVGPIIVIHLIMIGIEVIVMTICCPPQVLIGSLVGTVLFFVRTAQRIAMIVVTWTVCSCDGSCDVARGSFTAASIAVWTLITTLLIIAAPLCCASAHCFPWLPRGISLLGAVFTLVAYVVSIYAGDEAIIASLTLFSISTIVWFMCGAMLLFALGMCYISAVVGPSAWGVRMGFLKRKAKELEFEFE